MEAKPGIFATSLDPPRSSMCNGCERISSSLLFKISVPLPVSLLDDIGLAPCQTWSQIRQQAMIALEEATAVIMVVDGMAGCNVLDQEIARFLRQQKVPVILAVNKCESQVRVSRVADDGVLFWFLLVLVFWFLFFLSCSAETVPTSLDGSAPIAVHILSALLDQPAGG